MSRGQGKGTCMQRRMAIWHADAEAHCLDSCPITIWGSLVVLQILMQILTHICNLAVQRFYSNTTLAQLFCSYVAKRCGIMCITMRSSLIIILWVGPDGTFLHPLPAWKWHKVVVLERYDCVSPSAATSDAFMGRTRPGRNRPGGKRASTCARALLIDGLGHVIAS